MGVFAARSSLLAALLLCCSLPALAALLAHQKFCVLFRISNRDTKHTHTHAYKDAAAAAARLYTGRAGRRREGGREKCICICVLLLFLVVLVAPTKNELLSSPVRPWRRPYICVVYIILCVCVCVCLACVCVAFAQLHENFRLALCKF